MKNKILKTIGLALPILIAILWATIWLFKGKIIGLAKARFSTELRAHVNFSDADISLFRHFPKISVGLNNLQVICVGAFEGDTLLAAKQVDIALNFKSLLSGDSIRINPSP
jgi:hypothetical protein